MGPYVIHDLSASGAVHLATFDGEPMSNWISGCRLKKYKEPLTDEILQRLHVARERKTKYENMKQKAQEEARERAAKLRKQWATTQNRTTIQVIKETKQISNTLKPYILVEFGKKQMIELALVDSRADVNTISYETWEHIGKQPLEKSVITFDTVSRQTIPVEGCLDLEVFIGATNVCERFLVMKQGMMETSVILGQPWQRSYNDVPN